jgi:hypothetical protein
MIDTDNFASQYLFFQVIMTHATHLYLDHPSDADEEEPGLFWATRSSSARKVFSYMLPVGGQFENVSSFVQTEACRTYGMTECPKLTAPSNIIGLYDFASAFARVNGIATSDGMILTTCCCHGNQ